jgi:hypothetical protein
MAHGVSSIVCHVFFFIGPPPFSTTTGLRGFVLPSVAIVVQVSAQSDPMSYLLYVLASAGAIGSYLGSISAPSVAVTCDCSSPCDTTVLSVLEEQLARCGPENLVCPAERECQPSLRIFLGTTLAGLAFGFCGGAFFVRVTRARTSGVHAA